jgi:hypothetical protein
VHRRRYGNRDVHRACVMAYGPYVRAGEDSPVAVRHSKRLGWEHPVSVVLSALAHMPANRAARLQRWNTTFVQWSPLRAPHCGLIFYGQASSQEGKR